MNTQETLAIFTAIVIGLQFLFRYTGNDKKELKEEIRRLAIAIDKLTDNLKLSDEHITVIQKDIESIKKRHKAIHNEEL